MKFYINLECGNIFDYTREGYAEMLKEAKELYDFGDDTNNISLWEYYGVGEIVAD